MRNFSNKDSIEPKKYQQPPPTPKPIPEPIPEPKPTPVPDSPCELRNPKGLARPAASAFCLKVLDGRKFR